MGVNAAKSPQTAAATIRKREPVKLTPRKASHSIGFPLNHVARIGPRGAADGGLTGSNPIGGIYGTRSRGSDKRISFSWHSCQLRARIRPVCLRRQKMKSCHRQIE